MDRAVADVAVIGAGPAGSAAARLLASWGHDVVLLGRATRQPTLAESLPPSCTKLFEQIGVQRMIDDAGFIRATGNTVRWAGERTRVERFDAGVSGYQVARNELDALLVDAARATGVRVTPDASVRDAVREADAWRVSFESAAGGQQVRARWVIDASGRAGVLARRGFRKPDVVARTTAVIAVWERPTPWPVDDDTHTLVESYEGGWAWSVPVSTARRFVTVMLDPSVTDLHGGPRLNEAYAAELARTDMIARTVEGATMIGRPWACDASPYSAIRVFDDQLLLVGDAASFVDPLSSFGVKKGLASAWLGAVAVHTALTNAAMTTAAVELFGERERVMHEHLRRQSAVLSQEAAGAHASDFWNGRGDAAADVVPDELDVTVLRTDARVLSAFEEIRQRSSIALRLGDSVRVTERAIVRGHRMVLEDHLVAPHLPRGARYCRNVDLVLIARLAGQHDQVPDLFDAYNRLAPPAPLPDFLGALSTLVGLGFLSFLDSRDSAPYPVDA